MSGEERPEAPPAPSGIPAAVAARLDELAARYRLPADAPGRLASLLALVAADPLAPTTVRAPERAVDVHVADSLAGLEVPEVRAAGRLADLGAGAGFPGLVLAAALPSAHVALVESVGRKCTFLERAVERMGLGNGEVVCARAEAWDAGRGALDVVTARALAPLAVLVEYAAPLLRIGGVLVAWKGAPEDDEERAGREAAGIVGLEERAVVGVTPFAGADRRRLYVYSKVTETPPRFPRRPGMARKRPLSR